MQRVIWKRKYVFCHKLEDKNLQVRRGTTTFSLIRIRFLIIRSCSGQEILRKCGDYCYYALNSVLSSYEYIWMAEPDLKICSEKAEDFFKSLKNMIMIF